MDAYNWIGIDLRKYGTFVHSGSAFASREQWVDLWNPSHQGGDRFSENDDRLKP